MYCPETKNSYVGNFSHELRAFCHRMIQLRCCSSFVLPRRRTLQIQITSVFVIILGIPATKILSSWYSPSHVEVSCCFFGAIGTDTFSFVPSASNTELVNAFNASPSDQNLTKPVPCVSVSETELVTVYGTREGRDSNEFNQYLGSSISCAVHNCVLHHSKLCKNLCKVFLSEFER